MLVWNLLTRADYEYQFLPSGVLRGPTNSKERARFEELCQRELLDAVRKRLEPLVDEVLRSVESKLRSQMPCILRGAYSEVYGQMSEQGSMEGASPLPVVPLEEVCKPPMSQALVNTRDMVSKEAQKEVQNWVDALPSASMAAELGVGFWRERCLDESDGNPALPESPILPLGIPEQGNRANFGAPCIAPELIPPFEPGLLDGSLDLVNLDGDDWISSLLYDNIHSAEQVHG